VGVQLLLDAQQKQPLMYGLGMGGYDEPIVRLLQVSGWQMFDVPFFFKIVRPSRFLRDIVYLRRSAHRRLLFDMMAYSGLGWLAVRGVSGLRHRATKLPGTVTAVTVDEFSDWADELWEANKIHYGMSAVRDSATLRILYPKEQQRFIRLQVRDQGRLIGWAVMLNSQLSEHRQFGNMRLGSIVDCFASPAEATAVIGCAKTFLQRQGVDLIISNQAHAAWGRALDACGFMRGPSNFIFAASKKLAELLQTSRVDNNAIHINRGDGDGPINL
jgi:hypothetical protein